MGQDPDLEDQLMNLLQPQVDALNELISEAEPVPLP
jgi:hypothetical protein